MAGFNRVILIGNLTRDPELKQIPSGQSICRLGIATNRQFKNRTTGAVTQEVCFIDVDVWGAQAENCKQFLQKGKQVLIEGRLKLDSWQDAQGQNRSKHSIVADRVVFLAPGASATHESEHTSEESTGEAAAPEPSYKAARKGSVSKEKEKTPTQFNAGEIDFTDTPPFEGDNQLPF